MEGQAIGGNNTKRTGSDHFIAESHNLRICRTHRYQEHKGFIVYSQGNLSIPYESVPERIGDDSIR